MTDIEKTLREEIAKMENAPMTTVFDGVNVGIIPAQMLRARHIEFCNELLRLTESKPPVTRRKRAKKTSAKTAGAQHE